MTEVFCDDLRVTVPVESWPDLEPGLMEVLGDSGMFPELREERKATWRLDGALVRAERFGFVRAVSASGQALARFRGLGLLGKYLATLASVPHKVTGLHATMDRPEATPAVFERLMAKAASADGLRAGRKRIPECELQRYVVRLDGVDTGSMYCGAKTNEIRPVVYDKRLERQSKGFLDIGHDLTRYELRLRDVGASLRDAYDPTAIFWHYMAPDFLERPESAPVWSSGAQGFEVERPPALLPAARLLRRLETSPDLSSLITEARSVQGGIDLLCNHIRRQAAGSFETSH